MTTRPANVLYIETGQAGGGSFGSLYLLLKHIDRSKYNPVVVYLNDTAWKKRVEQLGIPVHLLSDCRYSLNYNPLVKRVVNRLASIVDANFGFFYLLYERIVHAPAIRSLVKIIDLHRIDLIHLNNQINRDLFGVFAAQKRQIPCISHLRSHRSESFDQKRAEFANKLVSSYIGATKNAADHWVSKGIKQQKTSVVYNGIPDETAQSVDLYSRFRIHPNRTFLFGCVATFNEVKGHDFLIDVFAKFIRRYPQAGLILVGDGPLKEKIQKKVDTFKLGEHVFLVGHQKDAKDIILSLDALLLPSKNENCSRVLLESMLVGTPIVATDVGGNPELIEDQVNGLLAPYGEIESFVETMEKLFDDKQMRKSFVENGMKKVHKQFTLKAYVSSIEEIYHNILQ